MLSTYRRWRITRSIEAGKPMPRSLANAIERSDELRRYANAMTRVRNELRACDAQTSPGLADRVMIEIARTEDETINSGPYRMEGLGFTRILAMAACVALLSAVSVLMIRPWSQSSSTIEVSGEFTTLVSLFRPLDNDIEFFSASLGQEFNALTNNAQGMAQGVMGSIPRVGGDGAAGGENQ